MYATSLGLVCAAATDVESKKTPPTTPLVLVSAAGGAKNEARFNNFLTICDFETE